MILLGLLMLKADITLNKYTKLAHAGYDLSKPTKTGQKIQNIRCAEY